MHGYFGNSPQKRGRFGKDVIIYTAQLSPNPSPQTNLANTSLSLSLPKMRHYLFFFLFLATLLSTSHARCEADNPIRMLRRQPGGAAAVSADSSKINCQSFRVGVEANNLRDWDTIPSYCKSYIKTYLEKKQYGLDVEAMVAAAVDYADTRSLDASPKDIWVFDVEETLISNQKYLASSQVDYG